LEFFLITKFKGSFGSMEGYVLMDEMERKGKEGNYEILIKYMFGFIS